jgi:hypothetical protein
VRPKISFFILLLPAVMFSLPAGKPFLQSHNAISCPFNISCRDGYTPTIIPPPNSQQSISDSTNCEALFNLAISLEQSFNNIPKQAYDTGRYFVEHCYDTHDGYQMFGNLSDACNDLEFPHLDTIWAQFRAWLKSVVYLNPTTYPRSWYFCADLNEYAHTFAHEDELGHQKDYKKAIAIIAFLSDSLKCYGHGSVTSEINAYHFFWMDTVKDSIITPFDSTILTLDQIGETFIRGFVKSGVASSQPIGGNLIAEFSAIKNPFKDEIELRYKLNRENLARIEIFDMLGKLVWGDGQGYHPPNESSSIKIETYNWQEGTYLARLSTFSNETKTITLKLIR